MSQPITIAVDSDLARMRDEWRTLQRDGWTSVYQTHEWCQTWQTHVGEDWSVTPCLVSGRDSRGALRFLLPLGIYSNKGAKVIRWLSHPVATYGLGVFDLAFLDETGGSLEHCWDDICRALPPADAIWLENMPASLDGRRHPLAGAFEFDDANCSYRLDLQNDFDALYARLRPAKSRSRARKRDQKLAEAGDLRFALPGTAKETAKVLNDMFDQQSRRLAEAGIHGVFDDASRQFVHGLAQLPDEPDVPRLMPYELSLDQRTVAVKLGIAFNDTFWAMVSSVDPTGIERLSPGEHALRRTIEACCRIGFARIDMAAGDTGYKQAWASEVVTLHTISRSLNLRGVVWRQSTAALAAGKKAIKNSETLWPLAQKLRGTLLGTKAS